MSEIKQQTDTQTTIQQLRDLVKKFVDEREWNQYHSPKNLSMNIAVEAAELMEKFLWVGGPAAYDELAKNKKEIAYELMDIICGCIAFANQCDIDIASTFREKLAHNAAKYPVEKVKGRSDKYTAYPMDKVNNAHNNKK